MANAQRGKIRHITLTTEYPDGTVKTAQIDPAGISKIVLDHDECKSALPGTWETDHWSKNPSCVVVRSDGIVEGVCSSQQHPPPGA